MGQSSYKPAAVTAEQQTAVEDMLRRTNVTLRVRERLEMVKATSQGYDLAAIAVWSGRSTRTVRSWLERFSDSGISALADAPRPGRPVRADARYRAALETAVETEPRSLGFDFDVWTSARLSHYLEDTIGTHIAPGWVRVLLGQLDFVSGRPKHTLGHLQDPDAVAASAAQIAAAEKKRGGCP